MGAYYYAAGQRIDLEKDDEHVAVDQNAVEKAGLNREIGDSVGRNRQGGVILAERSALDADTLSRLRQVGALQSAYRRNHAVIVPLPEVRVEFDNPSQRRAVMALLRKGTAPDHTIAEDTEERMVVKPSSGNGDDALRIANEIYERAHPAAASVRFVQFVPKPLLR